MSTLTHPLAVGPGGRDLFTPEAWLNVAGGNLREPSTPPALVDVFAEHHPAFAEAASAYAAAAADFEAIVDEALDLIEDHADARRAWAASTAGSKAPKPVDVDGYASRLVALNARRQSALTVALRASRLVDDLAPEAARSVPASVRDDVVASLRQAHADAVSAVSAASAALARLDSIRSSLGLLDVAALRASGVPEASLWQVHDDRLPRTLSEPVTLPPLLTAEAVDRLSAPIAAAVAAWRESKRARPSSIRTPVAPVGLGGML